MKIVTVLPLRALAALVLATLPFAAPAQQIPPNANVVGGWSALTNWPLIPIHAVMTPGGNVLSYGTDATGKQTGKFIYNVWNPNQGGLAAGHTTLANNTGTDIFCSAQVLLPQGDIFIAGGDNFVNNATNNTGNSDANIFNSANNSLTRAGSMNRARWYASITTLPNGDSYIQGGTSGTDRAEVRAANGTFRLLPFDTSSINWHYPRNFVAPDGRVFGIDADGRMYYISADLTTLTQAGTVAVTGTGSSAAMYAPGRILQIGGNSNGAITVDINSGTPQVAATASLASRRDLVTATVLANGAVLATGGSAQWNQLTGVNNSAAIWNPANGQWTIGPNGVAARLYHSIAMLLPDASVLVAGGGAPGPQTNTNAEIYYPPYLFNSAAGFATRPTLTAAPANIAPGTNFSASVGAADAITRVSLVKTSSVTHSWNMDQRFIPLTFTQSGTTLTITPPANTNLMPPGYYMLFALNSAGVPSVARIVKANVASPPTGTGSGTGLNGQYFNNVTLSGTPALQRAEAVDFDWGTGSPGTVIAVDNFSVRWSGQVEAPLAGSYQFQTVSDDGVRVYVNGQLIIDNWTDHGPTANASAAITLSAGSRTNISVEYYERGGGAVSRLQWRVPGAADFVAVPRDRLYASAPGGGGIDPNVGYSIVNRNSNKCVDVSGGSTADGANVVQWNCNAGANQKYKFTPTTGVYYRLVAQHSGKVLRVNNGSTTDGTRLVQTTWANFNSQQWQPVALGGGFYRFVNRNSGKVMEVPGCSTADGTQIQQRGNNGSTCQQFRLQ